MSQKITVQIHTRVAGYDRGQIVELDDSPRTRWLLKSHFVDLIDPPTLDWLDKPETHPEYKPKQRPEQKRKPIIPEPEEGELIPKPE